MSAPTVIRSVITIRETGDAAEAGWRNAAEAGEGTTVIFRVVESRVSRGFLYVEAKNMNIVIYDAVRGGADLSDAYCDGENPSGLGGVHAISPYTTGMWGYPMNDGWSPAEIIDDAGLTVTVMDETTDENGCLLYLHVVLLTPETRAEWMSATAEPCLD